jgi:hypothetical protein
MEMTMTTRDAPDREMTSVNDRTARPRYDIYQPHLDAPDPSIREAPKSIPVQRVSSNKVLLDPDAMEPGRPYAYESEGEWYAVVKRVDGKLDFYSVPRR